MEFLFDIIFVLSQLTCEYLLIGGRAIPESMYRFSTGEVFRKTGISCKTHLVAYCPAEKHKTSAVVLKT